MFNPTGAAIDPLKQTVFETSESRSETTYPQFYRDGQQLVKIGYSKSERRTYEHRSPRAVLDRLRVLVMELGKSGAKFTTEQLTPPLELRMKDVPSYQVYLCLAFMIRRGLVVRHGRSGYTIVGGHEQELPAGIEKAWGRLAAR